MTHRRAAYLASTGLALIAFACAGCKGSTGSSSSGNSSNGGQTGSTASKPINRGGPLDLTVTGDLAFKVAPDPQSLNGGAMFTNHKDAASGGPSCMIALDGMVVGKSGKSFDLAVNDVQDACPTAAGTFPIRPLAQIPKGAFNAGVTTDTTNDMFQVSSGTLTITSVSATSLKGKVTADFKGISGSSKTFHISGTFSAVPSK